jgi:hypothetical protein
MPGIVVSVVSMPAMVVSVVSMPAMVVSVMPPSTMRVSCSSTVPATDGSTEAFTRASSADEVTVM